MAQARSAPNPAPESAATGPAGAPHCNRLAIESVSREHLADDFLRVRRATERLAQPLSAEDQNIQSMAEASPVKWHRAHTSWFFEAFVLDVHDDRWESPDAAFLYLYNSYYNGIGDQYPRPQRGLISRPDVEEVTAYRERVEQAVLALIERCPESEWRELAGLIRLGLNHEQQHQELIVTDLKHGFSHNPLWPSWAPSPPVASHRASPLEWHRFEGGVHYIGFDAEGFCFDNERPRHRTVIEPFEIASRPVTCGEYLAFIEDGGYERSELWLSDGWAWARENGISAPLYWHQLDGDWYLYTNGGLRALDPEETLAHVSFYEAFAFAQWAGARLPTESEWEHAVAGAVGQPGHFSESGRLHPGTPPHGNGLVAALGDVWEWTASSYAPYPGFRAPPGAVGEYNGKFMANQMVLRGGSCATPRGHVRPTYRNFFYPPDRWQFSGVRLARDA
jgi:ergothioneine biosynthesis protein EgtB